MLYINEYKEEDIEDEATTDEMELFADQLCFIVQNKKQEEEKRGKKLDSRE